MSDLTAQKKEFSIVVNKKINDSWDLVISNLGLFLDIYCDYWYYIIHDKDINENGELKTPHLHLIIELGERKRGRTILKKIASELNYEIELISITPVYDLPKVIQYLTHKNNVDKFQYLFDYIKTSNVDRLNYLYNDSSIKKITTQELINICDNAKSIREIIEKIGINNYQRYYKTIEILRKGV